VQDEPLAVIETDPQRPPLPRDEVVVRHVERRPVGLHDAQLPKAILPPRRWEVAVRLDEIAVVVDAKLRYLGGGHSIDAVDPDDRSGIEVDDRYEVDGMGVVVVLHPAPLHPGVQEGLDETPWLPRGRVRAQEPILVARQVDRPGIGGDPVHVHETVPLPQRRPHLHARLAYVLGEEAIVRREHGLRARWQHARFDDVVPVHYELRRKARRRIED